MVSYKNFLLPLFGDPCKVRCSVPHRAGMGSLLKFEACYIMI